MILIREANPSPEEAKAFSQLADMATSHLFGALMGPAGFRMIETLFLLDAGAYSHRHVRFATVDGQIAGAVCGLSDEASWQNSLRVGLIQLRLLGWHLPGIIRRSWRIRRLIEFVNLPHPGQFYIPFLAVHPEFRHQGLGRALMQEAESIARSARCSVLALSADPTDPAAMRLYQSCGMHEVARSITCHFRGRDETLVRMEKPLT